MAVNAEPSKAAVSSLERRETPSPFLSHSEGHPPTHKKTTTFNKDQSTIGLSIKLNMTTVSHEVGEAPPHTQVPLSSLCSHTFLPLCLFICVYPTIPRTHKCMDASCKPSLLIIMTFGETLNANFENL